MGYAGLKQLIEQNAWREAGRELGQYMNGEWDDELAVLAATVFSALGDWKAPIPASRRDCSTITKITNCICCWAIIMSAKIATRRGSAMKMRFYIAAMKTIAGSYSSTKSVYSRMTGGAYIRFDRDIDV